MPETGAHLRDVTVGSLFSGAGLCDLGLEWAGMKHRFFCEADPFCRSVLRRHWPGVPIYEDVRDLRGVDLPPVDVLCGGFPCQDVSLAAAGKRKGITGKGSGLWHEYVRLIEEIRPGYVIVENVPGLLAAGVEAGLQDLAAVGYDTEWEVLPAAAVGAPHRRERVFLVAYPHCDGRGPEHGVSSSLGRDVGEGDQSWCVAPWLGVRIDRARRAPIQEAYGGCVLRRVDDGSPARLDGPAGVRPLPRELVLVWVRRLKALGNAITPQQAYAVAACIMRAEGLPVPGRPDRYDWLSAPGARREGREPRIKRIHEALF